MNITTAAQSPEAFAKLQRLVNDIEIAMITTVTPDGALRSRPMATCEFDDEGSLWFFTADDSGKAHDVEEENAVNVSYSDTDKQRYVSVTGNASVVHDRHRVENLWQSKAQAYFPRGMNDPHLALLRVRIESAEFWDSSSGKMLPLFGMSKAKGSNGNAERGEHTRVDVRATPASG